MVDPYSHIDLNDIYEYLASTEENHRVGKFVYSNLGMGLLGHILESVTGKSYETLLIEKVLKPLEMNQTRIKLPPEIEPLLIQGYTDKGNPTPIWTFNALGAAGALSYNANDMLKFIQANLNEKTSISNSLSKMRQFQTDGLAKIGWMKPTFVESFFGNEDIIWHNGVVGGYASYISIDPKAKTGVIVLVNKAVGVTMLGVMLTRQVRTQSWSKDLEK